MAYLSPKHTQKKFTFLCMHDMELLFCAISHSSWLWWPCNCGPGPFLLAVNIQSYLFICRNMYIFRSDTVAAPLEHFCRSKLSVYFRLSPSVQTCEDKQWLIRDNAVMYACPIPHADVVSSAINYLKKGEKVALANKHIWIGRNACTLLLYVRNTESTVNK